MRQHKLFWGSSYDRGLNVLLSMWPEIKEKYEDAELHIAYGWDLYDVATVGNAERIEWKKRMVSLMEQNGIIHHGRVGKSELQKIRKECGILPYTSDFTEIFCITAMEAQLDGCVPITPDIAALGEYTTGRVIIKGDIYNSETKKNYLASLLYLMGDEKEWKKLQKEGIEYAKKFTWDKIASKWVREFENKDTSIKISIITPTNRRGWWNIMADNLSKQSYKNFEWIIVDDYKDNRSKIALEYANKYNLDIKYVRGKKRAVKRTYGLVNANNTGFENSTGDLIVLLQDFILISPTSIEELVAIHRKNPNCLIAPVDMYFEPKIKPDTESEDWFNGELDVKGKFMRKNARIQNKEIRYSENPYEFEQNFGAIPRNVLEALGGWYEFFDEGLGFDNTDIAYRALTSGYGLIIDETNVATCIDHWKTLEGTVEHGLGRERRLNDPRFLFLMTMVDNKKLPLKRTQEIDDRIELLYEMPEDVPTKDAVKWVKANLDKIAAKWIKKYYDLL